MRLVFFLVLIAPLHAQTSLLFEAIEAGDTAAVVEYLEKGGKARAKGKNKRTAAMAAAEAGYPAILDLLADNGARLNAKDSLGETALVKAVKRGRMSIVANLLDRGVDLNIQNKQGMTALMHAAARNERFMIGMLAAKGADLEIKDMDRMTALFYAVMNSNLEAVATLIESGAVIDRKNKNGVTPLDYAKFFYHVDIGTMLMKNSYLAKPKNPLFRAVYENDPAQIEKLLKGGMYAEMAGKDGETALMVASRLGLYEVAVELAGNGADIKVADKRGETPLHEAVSEGRVEMTRMLLGAGARVNVSCADGLAPLGLAVNEKDETLFRMLREAGADVLYRKKGTVVKVPANAETTAQVIKALGRLPRRLGRCDDQVYSFRNSQVTPPVFTHKQSPQYPKRAVRSRLTGSVLLEAILGKDGYIRNIRVLEGVGNWKFGMEVSAVLALRQWKYEPGLVNGKPVDVRMTLKIDYTLR